MVRVPLQTPPRDRLNRPLDSLRVSVTDRCNIRCRYCMPEEEYVWLPRQSILSFEEIAQLVQVFSRLGVRKVRITGGEPLLRHDLPQLVQLLAGIDGIEDMALTTNGLLLARSAAELKQAGLDRVTVSLDTLRPDRFMRFTRNKRFADVLAGLEAASAAGFSGTKINSVVIRDENDDELVDLLDFGRERECEVRFIEYMDVGGATGWSPAAVVTKAEILREIAAHYGPVSALQPPGDRSAAPAERFSLPDGSCFGVIASTTDPFCGTCDRSRITADGMWFLCLYAGSGVDLKRLLRGGVADGELAKVIADGWLGRSDRGAEQRLEMVDRDVLYQVEGLREDPHREMHTRGG
ncbi:MAG: cyclic pyranopterin phosphate synthase MoaA [Gemmatimonas sp. SG8_17]|nr:MAG: cyclic pyranopterin phosphate synthase MoaA [Gemmatimonas sp. SG8_17]